MNHMRQALIAQLEWNSGGKGYGLCGVAGAWLWESDRPGPDKPDLISIVAVTGPPDKYTTEELQQIVEFAKEQTADYDRLFTYRRGCNMICLDKEEEGRWCRTRLSWTMGPMYSPTLEEALAVFKRLSPATTVTRPVQSAGEFTHTPVGGWGGSGM